MQEKLLKLSGPEGRSRYRRSRSRDRSRSRSRDRSRSRSRDRRRSRSRSKGGSRSKDRRRSRSKDRRRSRSKDRGRSRSKDRRRSRSRSRSGSKIPECSSSQEKRKYEDHPHLRWTQKYDRPLPQVLLSRMEDWRGWVMKEEEEVEDMREEYHDLLAGSP